LDAVHDHVPTPRGKFVKVFGSKAAAKAWVNDSDARDRLIVDHHHVDIAD